MYLINNLTPYAVNKNLLPLELRDVVIEFQPDVEMEAFLKFCNKHRESTFNLMLSGILLRFMSEYDTHGTLKMHPMHILSEQRWEALIPESHRGGKLLDVGAGQGFVTEKARHLFSEIVTTETSEPIARRLRERGFATYIEDIADKPDLFEEKSFDVISILNVLDRCTHPRTLLKNCINFLRDDGLLIITDPLPLEQRVFGKSHTVQENIVQKKTQIWEECLTDFYENVLLPLDLTPIVISRLPYVSRLDPENPYISLDNFLVVCKKK